jgi:hypothetical protein
MYPMLDVVVYINTNYIKTYLTNCRRGSRSPSRSATNAIVVDSPPGMIRAWHFFRSSSVRTSIGTNEGEDRPRSAFRWFMCSRNAPCSASTVSAFVELEGM